MLNQFDPCRSAQALHPQTHHRGSIGAGNGQDRVKVCIQGHYCGVLSQRECEDILVGRLPHSDFAYVGTFISKVTQLTRGIAWYSLVQH